MVKIMIMDLVVEMMVNGWRRRFQVVKGFAEYYVAKSKEVLQRIAKSFCAGPSSEMIVIDFREQKQIFSPISLLLAFSTMLIIENLQGFTSPGRHEYMLTK